jgi:hypothetical protein
VARRGERGTATAVRGDSGEGGKSGYRSLDFFRVARVFCWHRRRAILVRFVLVHVTQDAVGSRGCCTARAEAYPADMPQPEEPSGPGASGFAP